MLLEFPRDVAALRRKADELPDAAFGTEKLRQLGESLAGLLAPMDNVQVLATTEVAIDPAWRVLAVRQERGISVLCNPRVIDFGGHSRELECHPAYAEVLERIASPSKLTVEYRKIDGSLRRVVCNSNGARAVWRGVRTLDGQLFVEEMGRLQRELFLRTVRKRRASVGRPALSAHLS